MAARDAHNVKVGGFKSPSRYIRGYVEIGSRATLRELCRKTCRFESCYPHRQNPTEFIVIGMNTKSVDTERPSMSSFISIKKIGLTIIVFCNRGGIGIPSMFRTL